MRHRKKGAKLGRTASHRKALLRNLAMALFDRRRSRATSGRIRTTHAKAKALRPFAEKLITLAKRGDLHARRQVMKHIRDKQIVADLFDVLAPRYMDRPGGYTRIIKIDRRTGDGAQMSIIELVDEEVEVTEETATEKNLQQE